MKINKQRFSKVWKKNGFNSLRFDPLGLNVLAAPLRASKISAVLFMERGCLEVRDQLRDGDSTWERFQSGSFPSAANIWSSYCSEFSALSELWRNVHVSIRLQTHGINARDANGNSKDERAGFVDPLHVLPHCLCLNAWLPDAAVFNKDDIGNADVQTDPHHTGYRMASQAKNTMTYHPRKSHQARPSGPHQPPLLISCFVFGEFNIMRPHLSPPQIRAGFSYIKVRILIANTPQRFKTAAD